MAWLLKARSGSVTMGDSDLDYPGEFGIVYNLMTDAEIPNDEGRSKHEARITNG